ncbi:MAG: VCBS repeat-containing protein, partial [Candidatus Cloacimonadaceae bacterium]|nr:VCBS repeat-containing protein [Candidatus Cloacimonadaceae bacterium]
MKTTLIVLVLTLAMSSLCSQPWEADNSIFNPSGIPSLTFSQPRFADIDGDGDQDFLLGNTNTAPLYVKNIGSAAVPAFIIGENIMSNVTSLAAEMGICADIDGDGDLDLITGGYTGLHLFLNTGSVTVPVFVEAPGFFAGLNVGSNPVPDLADVDNDGDLDMVLGLSEDGGVRIYLNTGNASAAIFSETAMQVIGDVGLYAYPVFCDLDADGDQDILVGRDSHGFVYYRNMGSPLIPNWQSYPDAFAGLGMQTYWNSPDLVDLNNDGLFDLVFGTASGPLQYYVNAGTATNPVWQANTSLFGGVLDVGGASSPVFYDFDGDLDM